MARHHLVILAAVLAVGCEEGPPSAPGTLQVFGVGEVCSAWCNPLTGCGVVDNADAEVECVNDCIVLEMFQAPACTAARQGFYNCQLDFRECEMGPGGETCTCDPTGFCGNSPTDNRFVASCAADLDRICSRCATEAAFAACQLVGRCVPDPVLNLCAACINNEQAYRECLDTSSCP